MIPSISHKYPTPFEVMQLQIMSDPTPFLVAFTSCGVMKVPESLVHAHLLPSDPNLLIFVSSEKITLFQSSTVQSLCAFANDNRSFRFFLRLLVFFFCF